MFTPASYRINSANTLHPLFPHPTPQLYVFAWTIRPYLLQLRAPSSPTRSTSKRKAYWMNPPTTTTAQQQQVMVLLLAPLVVHSSSSRVVMVRGPAMGRGLQQQQQISV